MPRPKYELTNRELDIMNILWESEEPLIALEISRKSDGIPMNTIQSVLRKLLNKKYIKVADIVYSKTVLSRSYLPAISPAEYEAQRVFHTIQNSSLHDFTSTRFMSAYIDQTKDKDAALKEIDQLQELLQEKRKELSKEEKT